METLLKTWKSIPIQEINHHFSRECGFSINPQEFGFKNLDDLVEDVLILCPETLRIEDGSVKLRKICQNPTQILTCVSSMNESKRFIAQASSTSSKSKILDPSIAPFEIKFSDNPLDYCNADDQVAQLSLPQDLKMGDIFHLKILSVASPNSFHVRLLGPKNLVGDFCLSSLSGFAKKMSRYYEEFQDDDMLRIDEKSFPLEGLIVACPYYSQRRSKYEWRRAMILQRSSLNLNFFRNACTFGGKKSLKKIKAAFLLPCFFKKWYELVNDAF